MSEFSCCPSESVGGTLFIAGLPRSGTSLLCALLNKHPEIALMFEAEIHSMPALAWAVWGRRRMLRRLDFWNGVLTRHRIGAEQVPAEADSADRLARWCYRTVRERKGARWGGEKTPHSAESLEILAERFPDARFIIIHRDLAATVSSARMAGRVGARFFSSRGRIARNFRMAGVMYASAAKLRERGRNVLHLDYGDLVDHPEQECRRVCAFLELPWHPEVAVLEGADCSAVPPGMHHSGVRGSAIQRRATDGQILTPRDRALCERCDAVLRHDRWRSGAVSEESAPPDVALSVAWTGWKGRWFLFMDRARTFVLLLLPLPVWRGIRGLRGRDSEPSPQVPLAPPREHEPAAETSGIDHAAVMIMTGSLPDNPLLRLAAELSRLGVSRTLRLLNGCSELLDSETALPVVDANCTAPEHLREMAATIRGTGRKVAVAAFFNDGRCSVGVEA